jgi:selenide,water dikinase
VGLETPDDAGVYRLSGDIALVQTVDYITPIVDDAFTFGRIAATNALSDVWAMGGVPLAAMNIVCFPEEKFEIGILQETLRGGLATLEEADCALLGGHSVDNGEFTYGMAVTGRVHPERFLTARGARPGEKLILTKALGTGIVALAARGDLAPPESREAMVTGMTTLNRIAGEIMLRYPTTACTDITGYGLVGHACEMIGSDPIAITLSTGAVPLLPGTAELVRMGMVPATLYSNRQYHADRVEISGETDPFIADVLYDPQTSGGLLFSLPAEAAGECLVELQEAGITGAAIIGEVIERTESEKEIRIVP